MRPTAVQFGAGNIGRGFLAQLFHESDLDVVFVDVDPGIIGAINREGRYTIHIVGPAAESVAIDGITAISGSAHESVAEAVAGCSVVCTAVGAGSLNRIASNLAAGLELRFRRRVGPLNILICENLHDAAAVLRELVSDCLPEDTRADILSLTGFVHAVVSRMVPLQERSNDDSLAIRVEAYKRLPVDGRALLIGMPEVCGIEPVENFEAHVERKLYSHNCAHATLGYLGYQRRLRYGYEALENSEIRWLLYEGKPSVLGETGEALIHKHGFDSSEHESHVADLIRRFANVELGDTCFRLARDPIRKLAADDRLVGAARLCEACGIPPLALSVVIGEALRFNSSDDPSAVELQRRLSKRGFSHTLEEVCGIRPEEWLAGRVKAAYDSAEEIHDAS